MRHQPPKRDDSLLSESEREEGELSGEKEESVLPHKVDCLCPPDLFPRVLTKSVTLPARPPRHLLGPRPTHKEPLSPRWISSLKLWKEFLPLNEHFHQSKYHNRAIDKLYTAGTYNEKA